MIKTTYVCDACGAEPEPEDVAVLFRQKNPEVTKIKSAVENGSPVARAHFCRACIKDLVVAFEKTTIKEWSVNKSDTIELKVQHAPKQH